MSNSSLKDRLVPHVQTIGVTVIHFGPIAIAFAILVWLSNSAAAPQIGIASLLLTVWTVAYARYTHLIPQLVDQKTYDKFNGHMPSHLPKLLVARSPLQILFKLRNATTYLESRHLWKVFRQTCLRLTVRYIGLSLMIYWYAVMTLAVGAPFVVFSVLLLFTTLGIALSYHRLLSHSSFKAAPWFEHLVTIAAVLAWQGKPDHWAGTHLRGHHAHSDKKGDPHSPHVIFHTNNPEDDEEINWHDQTFFQKITSFLHAHMFWLYSHKRNQKYIDDYMSRKPHSLVKVYSNNFVYFTIALSGLLIPLALMGWQGFFWAGALRVFVLNQATFSVNSVCHITGNVSFPRTGGNQDHSRNHLIVALFSAGEGNHGNHHDYSSLAGHGIFPGEFDLAASILRFGQKLGFVISAKWAEDRLIQKVSG